MLHKYLGTYEFASALEDAGIETLDQLAGMSDEQLLAIDGIGRRAVIAIRDVIANPDAHRVAMSVRDTRICDYAGICHNAAVFAAELDDTIRQYASQYAIHLRLADYADYARKEWGYTLPTERTRPLGEEFIIESDDKFQSAVVAWRNVGHGDVLSFEGFGVGSAAHSDFKKVGHGYRFAFMRVNAGVYFPRSIAWTLLDQFVRNFPSLESQTQATVEAALKGDFAPMMEAIEVDSHGQWYAGVRVETWMSYTDPTVHSLTLVPWKGDRTFTLREERGGWMVEIDYRERPTATHKYHMVAQEDIRELVIVEDVSEADCDDYQEDYQDLAATEEIEDMIPVAPDRPNAGGEDSLYESTLAKLRDSKLFDEDDDDEQYALYIRYGGAGSKQIAIGHPENLKVLDKSQYTYIGTFSSYDEALAASED